MNVTAMIQPKMKFAQVMQMGQQRAIFDLIKIKVEFQQIANGFNALEVADIRLKTT